jgi:hypothetical protein
MKRGILIGLRAPAVPSRAVQEMVVQVVQAGGLLVFTALKLLEVQSAAESSSQ